MVNLEFVPGSFVDFVGKTTVRVAKSRNSNSRFASAFVSPPASTVEYLEVY